MKELMHDFLDILLSNPYIYVFVFLIIVVFAAIILLIIMRKRISNFIKIFWKKHSRDFTLAAKKETTVTVSTNSKKEGKVSIHKVDMQESGIHSVNGSVTIDNVKMKNSYIGDIRSE